jgi:hypothetical protein
MFNHAEILDKIDLIKDFFESVGIKKIEDIPKNWHLDSSYKFIPIDNNYKISLNGEERILLSVNVFIVGGVNFVLSGKMGFSVYETIRTDYNFVGLYHNISILKNEFRDWKIKQLL